MSYNRRAAAILCIAVLGTGAACGGASTSSAASGSRQASSPKATPKLDPAVSIPSGFPADVPIYPGARLTAAVRILTLARMARPRAATLRLPCLMLVGEAPVMTGPGDEMAAGTAGRGRLRASHADREQVIGTLKAVFVQGLLDKDEFDLRVGQAFASRTYAELAAITAGIPARPDPAPPPKPARAQARQPVLRPGRVITAASALYAGVWAFVFLFPMGADNKAAFLLFWTSAFIYLGVWITADLLICHRRPRPRRRRRTSRPRSLVHHQGPALDH